MTEWQIKAGVVLAVYLAVFTTVVYIFFTYFDN